MSFKRWFFDGSSRYLVAIFKENEQRKRPTWKEEKHPLPNNTSTEKMEKERNFPFQVLLPSTKINPMDLGQF